MISNIQETRAAKSILEEAKEELRKDGLPFKAEIKVGIMIEKKGELIFYFLNKKASL